MECVGTFCVGVLSMECVGTFFVRFCPWNVLILSVWVCGIWNKLVLL